MTLKYLEVTLNYKVKTFILLIKIKKHIYLTKIQLF